jgi:hypothetical protein
VIHYFYRHLDGVWAGRSIAGLAHNNTNLRTVIVEDTLISDEALDEIDLACLFNESTAVEITQKRAAALAAGGSIAAASPTIMTAERYKEAVAAAAAKKAETPRLCVANEFNSCPHGASCLYAHGATNASALSNGELSPEEAAKRRKGWQQLLQGEDEEADSSYNRTRNKKLNDNTTTNTDEPKAKPALKFTLNKPAATTTPTNNKAAKTNSKRGGNNNGVIALAVAVAGAVIIVAAALKFASKKQ